jgi:hypothetical protein
MGLCQVTHVKVALSQFEKYIRIFRGFSLIGFELTDGLSGAHGCIDQVFRGCTFRKGYSGQREAEDCRDDERGFSMYVHHGFDQRL